MFSEPSQLPFLLSERAARWQITDESPGMTRDVLVGVEEVLLDANTVKGPAKLPYRETAEML